jgi:hypothetical protein
VNYRDDPNLKPYADEINQKNPAALAILAQSQTRQQKGRTPAIVVTGFPETAVKPNQLDAVRADEIYRKQYTDLVQPVQGLICEGATLLVAPSKVGKSWLALDLCLKVVRGEPFLNRATKQGDVLYIALEDSERRLKERMRKLSPAAPPPPTFYILTEAPLVECGLIDQLDRWMTDHPQTILIVIDTLQRIRGMTPNHVNAYQADYQFMTPLKKFADKHHIALLLIHHMNKLRNVDDPFDKISGSTGLMGVADTTILIDRKRGECNATMRFTGRDVYGNDFVIAFADGIWHLVSEDALQHSLREAYEENPTVRLIRNILRDFPVGKFLSYKEFRSEANRRMQMYMPQDSKEITKSIRSLTDSLMLYDGISIETGVVKSNGRGIIISAKKKTPYKMDNYK